MKQKKINSIIFVLVIVAVIVSILGTFLLINAFNVDEPAELEHKTSSSGEISLNIQSESAQEYSSTGMISLKIVGE